MRIAVVGAGGVGGYFGGLLARAGHDVAFIARGAHLAAMRARGLRLTGPRGEHEITTVRATDDAASLDPVETVLFCVKCYNTSDAALERTIALNRKNGVYCADKAPLLPSCLTSTPT